MDEPGPAASFCTAAADLCANLSAVRPASVLLALSGRTPASVLCVLGCVRVHAARPRSEATTVELSQGLRLAAERGTGMRFAVKLSGEPVILSGEPVIILMGEGSFCVWKGC